MVAEIIARCYTLFKRVLRTHALAVRPVWMVTTCRASSPESAVKETSHFSSGSVTLSGTVMVSRKLSTCRTPSNPKQWGLSQAGRLPWHVVASNDAALERSAA